METLYSCPFFGLLFFRQAFNFLASLINGNGLFFWGLFAGAQQAFNFLASLINGNSHRPPLGCSLAAKIF